MLVRLKILHLKEIFFTIGQHIHLTEDYLKKIDDNEYKPFRAAEFVHNWATLRFGVFDEHGYQGDPLYPLFYWDKKTKKMKANMCTNTDPKIQIGYESCFIHRIKKVIANIFFC